MKVGSIVEHYFTKMRIVKIYDYYGTDVADLEDLVQILPNGKTGEQGIPLKQLREIFPRWMFWKWFS